MRKSYYIYNIWEGWPAFIGKERTTFVSEKCTGKSAYNFNMRECVFRIICTHYVHTYAYIYKGC